MIPLFAALGLVVAPGDTVPAIPAAADPPAVEITLDNNGSYLPGSPVRVQVRTRDDGYLVVFRVDGDGLVRVLFPLDPTDDAFVRGGKSYELQGRDGNQAFLADDLAGTGMVYAAAAAQPYRFDDFVANGHWDYGALRLRDSTSDAESDLSDIVGRMTGGRHFDYDAVGYTVQQIAEAPSTSGGGYYSGYYDPFYNPAWRCLGCGWGYPGAAYSLGLSFGYSPFYDPWFYSPWGYDYGYYSGGGYWFPGTYPVIIGRGNPRLPAPVGRPRPRPGGREPTGAVAPDRGGRNAPQTMRAAPPQRAGNAGTRARPRPYDLNVAPGRAESQAGQWSHPVFRQPPTSASSMMQEERGRAAMSARPVYREPPRYEQAPAARSMAPPPSARTSAPPRSAPSESRSRSSPSGGHGGRGRG